MAVPKARSIIRGRYQLESMIGEGGMASIWRARDLTLARSVAVKLLFARDDRDRNALVERFLREARIAASVQHRNVIQIVDFGTTEENVPFMVMELLEGEPLSGMIYRERRLHLVDVVQIASLTLRGLSAVHAAGIIHRDLKPDNIYLKRESDAIYPKILDFGISRSVEPQSGRRSALTTREGMIIGTPEYMSPEQARGVKDIDPRTDLYSMGVILYEALGGRLPFYSENVGDLIIQIVTGSAPTLHELDPRFPIEVSDVVAKAMARNREDRYASAADMQAALLSAAALVTASPTPRTLSDMPPVDLSHIEETSGTQRITPSDRATLMHATGGVDSGRPTSDAFGVVPPVTQTLETPPQASMLDGRQVQRWALPLLAAALACYSAIILVHAHGAQPAAPPVAERVTPTSAPASSTIRLTGLPADANILLDGQVGAATMSLARSMQQHAVEVSAPGKQPYRATFAADRDQTIAVSLADSAGPPSKAAAAPRAKPRVKHTPAKSAPKEQRALRNLDF